jgi:hypothetical protein
MEMKYVELMLATVSSKHERIFSLLKFAFLAAKWSVECSETVVQAQSLL